jgi:outer membrane translocation and assembly module TamA
LDALLNGLVPGGFFLLEFSAEMRNRIAGNFGGAVFIDVGNTWNSYSEIQPQDFAVATGFGFRYYSQFAPFRIDFGFKVYDPFDKSFIFDKSRKFWKDTFQFHFGIGEAF